jgi:6-phosphogluconolactonase (cycloisomerase 2 family)
LRIAVDPLARFAYVTSPQTLGANSVSMYAVTSNGGLTPLNPSSVIAGTSPIGITVDPTSRFVYVTNESSDDVSQFSIAPNGQLTALNPSSIAAGAGPEAVVFHPSLAYAYVVNYGTWSTGAPQGSVSQYSVGTNGALSPLTPASVNAGVQSTCVAIHPSGNYLYVGNSGGATVSQYLVGSGGLLSPMSPASFTVTTTGTVENISVDPSGKFAYVSIYSGSPSNDIYQYSIGTNGALAPLTPAVVAGGAWPGAVVTTAKWQSGGFLSLGPWYLKF